MTPFSLMHTHPSWHDAISNAFHAMDPQYVEILLSASHWLPGPEKIFNAFSLPLDQVNYVLLGESPYPRVLSANGYAFWDAAVTNLWSDTGLSKAVNRATSLRNIIKMLLLAKKSLKPSAMSQEDVARVDKTGLVQTNADFFQNFMDHGFLLLNASLVLREVEGKVRQDVTAWQPFLKSIFMFLVKSNPSVAFLLLGNLAQNIKPLLPPKTRCFVAEHPYNISFIQNKKVLDFFRPLDLLKGV